MAEDVYSLTKDAATRIVAATRRVEAMPPTPLQPRGWGGAGAPRQRRMKLIDVLYASTSATAYFLDWSDAGGGTFTDADTATVKGDLMTGFGFIDQKIIAMDLGGVWYCMTAGSFTCRGTLDTALSAAGTATVLITKYTSGAWAATAMSVVAREFLGLTDPLAIGTVVMLSWCDLSQQWLVTGAAC